MRSRVMPGSSVTIERRVPVRRLKSVDLPTLGRPTITMDGSLPVIVFALLMILLFDWLFDLLFIGEPRRAAQSFTLPRRRWFWWISGCGLKSTTAQLCVFQSTVILFSAG